MQHMKIGIAGAGIMGRLLAFALCNAGYDITLFDQGKKNNCSNAAAGLLTPVAELEKNDLIIYQLGKEALEQHWPNILKKLSNKIYFQHSGSLVVAHPRDHTELTRFTQAISHKTNKIDIHQKLNQQEIKQLEPALYKFDHGYYFPNEGQIDGQTLLTEIGDYLNEKNITWLFDTWVSAVEPKKIITKDDTYHFDMVLDCRGLGSKNIFPGLRSVRGELIWLHAPDVFITRPLRFLHPRYSLYIAPRPQQMYLIGASEIDADDHSDISVRTLLELLTAAYYVHSNFSEARLIKTVTQCRPTLTDHLPKIKYSDGFIAVNGLYRHGFLIAPTLMMDIMQFIAKDISATRYPQLWEKHS